MIKGTLFLLALSLVSQTAWSEPLREIECTIVPIERSKIHPSGDNAALQSGYTPTLDWISTNWSGYVAAKDLIGSSCSHGSVTQVSGSWVVPKLSSTPDDSYCSIWVGIDGYLNGTVEQIGTAHDWWKGSQENYAWFEMYPAGSNAIVGFPVNVGDVVSASVNYIGSDTFELQISNLTQGVTTKVPTSNTMSSSALRTSAEWVVEAPYLNGILPLSDFQSVSLSDCTAEIKGVEGPINGNGWIHERLTMVSSWAMIEAQASALSDDGKSFQVAWVSE